MARKASRTSFGSTGFTIVELLIVIVVIAILAAITIVSYNGITSRANDATILADASAIRNAVEGYKSENGNYPICTNGDGTSCDLASLSSTLVPQYVSILPNDSNFPYKYVATENGASRWSVRIYKKSIGGYCKFGTNELATWWSNAPAC